MGANSHLVPLAAAAVCMAVALGGCSGDVISVDWSQGESPAPTATPSTTLPAPDPGGTTPGANGGISGDDAQLVDEAVAVIEEIPVKGRAPKTGYSRDEFGQRWADVDRNGCDQRNDVLTRDLEELTYRSPTSCAVASGVLEDPYTGERIDFVRGADTSSAVQIDHVVALSNAWQTGAQQLDPDQREQFANDTVNLLAVDGPTNQAKGDGDAATWLPPRRDAWCGYVARQTVVKDRYGLWMTAAEHDRITEILAIC